MSTPQRQAVIFGAGPAGLTAALELLDKTDVAPVILEMSDAIGGLSRTVAHEGNRIDIGGHRFFSKSGRIMDWWLNLVPLQGRPARDDIELSRELPMELPPDGPDPEHETLVMLVRRRLSRIYFLRQFFDYPLSLKLRTFLNLGLARTAHIILDYLRARLSPIEPERSLEDFLVNRFGRTLYATFFRDYTEKVWGVPCDRIDPSWGAQRIKGLSISKLVLTALKRLASRDRSLDQKNVETSLIDRFLYPKLGPGQLWERAAELVTERGGQVLLHRRVSGLVIEDGRIVAARAVNETTGAEETYPGDFFISSIPVRELVPMFGELAPAPVRDAAAGLVYRDFVTVGVLLRRMQWENTSGQRTVDDIVPDNWVYIQEPDVKVGRLQIFNNWSPYLVKDPDTVWVGMEYFCTEGDAFWNMSDEDIARLAVTELAALRAARPEDVLDTAVIRVPKAYPAYFGAYADFPIVREFTDGFDNLFLVGRNGMHRYNNMDHSMLSAMAAVENIRDGRTDKKNIWSVNSEDDYHETRSA